VRQCHFWLFASAELECVEPTTHARWQPVAMRLSTLVPGSVSVARNLSTSGSSGETMYV
jgi:hypothetical protein